MAVAGTWLIKVTAVVVFLPALWATKYEVASAHWSLTWSRGVIETAFFPGSKHGYTINVADRRSRRESVWFPQASFAPFASHFVWIYGFLNSAVELVKESASCIVTSCAMNDGLAHLSSPERVALHGYCFPARRSLRATSCDWRGWGLIDLELS
jgi:hypothetical protein